MRAEQILQEILFRKGFYKEIGVTSNTVSVWKFRFKHGKMDHSKMEEILYLAGYKKIQWALYEKKS